MAAEDRIEPVLAGQCGEPFGLGTVPPFEDTDDGRFEVVVPDPAGHTTEVREGQHVAFEERFLRLGGERDVNALPERDSRITNIQHFTTSPAIVA